MFGLTGPEGNHGEDVKEYWWYLDSTPTPLVACAGATTTRRPRSRTRSWSPTNAARGRDEPEYELLDTGVFEDGATGGQVDYAKAAPDDVLMRIRVATRARTARTLHVLPTLWFRNTWDWGDAGDARPSLRVDGERDRGRAPDARPLRR